MRIYHRTSSKLRSVSAHRRSKSVAAVSRIVIQCFLFMCHAGKIDFLSMSEAILSASAFMFTTHTFSSPVRPSCLYLIFMMSANHFLFSQRKTQKSGVSAQGKSGLALKRFFKTSKIYRACSIFPLTQRESYKPADRKCRHLFGILSYKPGIARQSA